MKTKKPKTIKEAIDDLQNFLESDLWSRFYPIHRFPAMKNGKKVIVCFKRVKEDLFKNEEEFIKYLREHFDILRKQIRRIKK